jgi:hypothetical protein
VRTPLRLAAAALIAVAFALLPSAAPAASDGYNLTGLQVEGGTVWHRENAFTLSWDPNPPGSHPVHWAIRDELDRIIPGYPPQEWPYSVLGGVHVPPVPGAYIFEVWGDRGPGYYGNGRYGPPVVAYLFYDDVRPAPVAVAAPTWVAAGSRYRARIGHPAAPLPISGIVGYAVSVDEAAAGDPCAASTYCEPGEVDLMGGIGDDSIELPGLPEGISYVHAVAVSGSGMASGAVGTAPIGVDGTPPVVHLEGLPSGWAAGPVRLTAVAEDPLSGMAAAGAGGPATAIAIDGAPAQLVPGAAARATVAGEGVHQLSFYGRDAVGNTGDGSLPFAHPGTATVRIDETGPSVRFAAPDPGDPERIEAIVADALSGPDPDRGAIELRPAGSSGRFQPLPTDVGRGRLVARWASDDFPHGAYEFRATGYDAAGNATTSTAGPGGAFVLDDPVKREARLAFGFGAGQLVFQRCSRSGGSRRCHRDVVRSFARRPAARTLPCCHGAVVGGLLVDAAGEPLGGQTVEVVETLARGARNGARRTTLTTDPDGRFSTRLAPGPSREVSAEFPGTRHLTRALGRDLRLRVRAAVHLRVSTGHVAVGGAPVVFIGKIAHPEAHLPKSGLSVQLEFRLPGLAWAQFRTVQTDAQGRFRYPYQFSDDDSNGVRFLFRALVPATGNWPFAPATSRPLAVTG